MTEETSLPLNLPSTTKQNSELGEIIEESPHTPQSVPRSDTPSWTSFILFSKLDSTLRSFTNTRAVITEEICTAQVELCKKLSVYGRLNQLYCNVVHFTVPKKWL